MINILHVSGSPRKERSVSIRIASAYLDACTKKYPDNRLKTIDLWTDKLPELDENIMNAKYAALNDQELSLEQIKSWNSIKSFVDEFLKADLLLFSIPMWNFGIPYKLKQLIDVISHKDLLFSFDERGFNGLLTNKKAVLIATRGINYTTGTNTPESEFDFQNSYMLMWLRFIGITDVTIITAEQTLFGAAAAIQAENQALEEAITAAEHLDFNHLNKTHHG